MASSTIPAGGASGGLQPKYQKFTSSGTFTLPDGYGAAKPLLITIQVIGGGGAGGGQLVTSNNGTKVGEVTSNNYYGNGTVTAITGPAITYTSANNDGRGGGSGGIAATQMYLTSNLTITVGAAGTRSLGTYAWTTSNTRFWNNQNYSDRDYTNFGTFTGGTGGTTTAGSVSSAGGAGGVSNFNIRVPGNNGAGTATAYAAASTSSGAGGTPSGTAGDATPLLGTLAGGSGTSSRVFGSFGVGGIKTDGSTSTGVEGTGGGFDSIGAPGAVVITWWQ